MTPDSATVDSEARSRGAALDEARRLQEMLLVSRRYVIGAIVIWTVVGLVELVRAHSDVAWTVALYRAATVGVALVPAGVVLTRPVDKRTLVGLLGAFLAIFGVSLLAMCAVDRGRAEIYPFRLLVLFATMGTTLPFRVRHGILVQLGYTVATLAAFALSALVVPGLGTALADEAARRDVIGAVPLMLVGSALAVWIGEWSWHSTQAWLRQTDLGRYTLRQKLGAGGMGEVWVAWHASMRRLVALKILRLPKHKQTSTAAARFDREIHATASLSHPNTIRIFDHGITDDGLPYYTMELLEGASLGATVRRSGPLSAARVERLMRQFARALGEAHGKGIVHRDVKPDNLFIANAGGERDFAKVLDFGIAQFEELAPAGISEATAEPGTEPTSAELTGAGVVPGTVTYMAPEVARGGAADPRSDVYALGVSMYYALTGSLPIRAKTASAVLEAHERGPLPDVATRAPFAVPPTLASVIMRCLSKEPDDRYPNAGLVADALDGFTVDQPTL